MKASFDKKNLIDASDSIAEKGFLFQKMIFSFIYKSHLSVETKCVKFFLELKAIDKWIRNLFTFISQAEPF